MQADALNDDYLLIRNMSYEIHTFWLDEKVLGDLLTGQLGNKEEYLRVLAGYGIARYIRDHLNYQCCLSDLNEKEDYFC